MEQEFPCSPDTSFEIPSIIEAISSSIDDSHFNFNELEQSTDEASTTNESDYMEVEGSWTQPTPQHPDQYNQNYLQNYQQQQQQQNWNYQQGYSQYPQYGYMTPSPYNSYYMESPPVDYHHNYAYNSNMMTNYEQQQQPQQQQQQPYMFNGNQNSAVNPQGAEFSCSICIRTFKNSSNLTRHYASKTHVKRLESKRLNSRVTVIRTKKPRVNGIGSSFTDISKDERAFLWQLDDEIFQFLQIYEQENARNDIKQDQALPTPPLSPNSRAIEERKFTDGLQSNLGLVKTESVITIVSSSENLQGSPLSVRSSSMESVVETPKMEDSENMGVNIKEETNITTNLSPGSVKPELETSDCDNLDYITSNDANGDNQTSTSANVDTVISKSKQTSDITSNNVQNNSMISNNSNIGDITSNNTNFDVITVKSEQLSNITTNHEVARTPTMSQPSPSNEYQSNTISTNLTTEFSSMISTSHEYGDQFVKLEPQMNNKTEAQPLTYENSTKITSNYENHYSSNQHQNYYNTNHQTSNIQTSVSHGSGYQQVTSYAATNSMSSGHITSNYVNSSHMNATNASYSSATSNGYISNPSPVHQSSSYVVMKNITSKPNTNSSIVNATSNSGNVATNIPNITSNNSINTNCTNITSNNVNIASNNLQGIKMAPNNPKSAAVKYQTVTNLLTSGNKASANQTSNITSNPQIHLQPSNKVTSNRIITINPSTLTKASTTTASGLRITSINPNLTSNNGVTKNPTTYTLTSSNSGKRYLNATNLIGNSVKIQQISPNGIKNFRIVNNSHQALQNKVKIPHSGCNVQQNSPSYGQSSPSYGQNSPNHLQSTEGQQTVDQNVAETPSRQTEPQFSIPNSPSTPSSPTVLIQQETGEKYEIIFSDENFGDNFS